MQVANRAVAGSGRIRMRLSQYAPWVLFGALIMTSCDRPHIEGVLMPALSSNSRRPICAVYTDNPYPAFDAPEPHFSVSVVVWPDGRIIWAKDLNKGGPPYFSGTVQEGAIDRFVSRMRSFGYLRSNSADMNCGLDATYRAVVVCVDDKFLSIKSWHELYDGSDAVVTSHGVEPLRGRDRAQVLAEQPRRYRKLLEKWDRVKNGILSLVPESGAPLDDVDLVLHRWEEQ